MDDPWGNAWVDSGKPTLKAPEEFTTSSWTRRSQTHDDQEVDIAVPSWSTGVEIQWDEPSNHANMWSQPGDSEKVWRPSSYEHLPLGKAASVTFPSPSRSPVLEPEPYESIPVSPALPLSEVEGTSPLPSPTGAAPVLPDAPPPYPPLPAPDSPDVFGSFETGLYQNSSIEGNDVEPWTSTGGTTSEDTWGSLAWGAPVMEKQAEMTSARTFDPTEDDWEAVRRRKEKQDSAVVRYFKVLPTVY
jgi:hypothetical protein